MTQTAMTWISYRVESIFYKNRIIHILKLIFVPKTNKYVTKERICTWVNLRKIKLILGLCHCSHWHRLAKIRLQWKHHFKYQHIDALPGSCYWQFPLIVTYPFINFFNKSLSHVSNPGEEITSVACCKAKSRQNAFKF